eukprot:gene27947-8821_t
MGGPHPSSVRSFSPSLNGAHQPAAVRDYSPAHMGANQSAAVRDYSPAHMGVHQFAAAFQHPAPHPSYLSPQQLQPRNQPRNQHLRQPTHSPMPQARTPDQGQSTGNDGGRDALVLSLQAGLRKARSERDQEVRDNDMLFSELQEYKAALQQAAQLEPAASPVGLSQQQLGQLGSASSPAPDPATLHRLQYLENRLKTLETVRSSGEALPLSLGEDLRVQPGPQTAAALSHHCTASAVYSPPHGRSTESSGGGEGEEAGHMPEEGGRQGVHCQPPTADSSLGMAPSSSSDGADSLAARLAELEAQLHVVVQQRDAALAGSMPNASAHLRVQSHGKVVEGQEGASLAMGTDLVQKLLKLRNQFQFELPGGIHGIKGPTALGQSQPFEAIASNRALEIPGEIQPFEEIAPNQALPPSGQSQPFETIVSDRALAPPGEIQPFEEIAPDQALPPTEEIRPSGEKEIATSPLLVLAELAQHLTAWQARRADEVATAQQAASDLEAAKQLAESQSLQQVAASEQRVAELEAELAAVQLACAKKDELSWQRVAYVEGELAKREALAGEHQKHQEHIVADLEARLAEIHTHFDASVSTVLELQVQMQQLELVAGILKCERQAALDSLASMQEDMVSEQQSGQATCRLTELLQSHIQTVEGERDRALAALHHSPASAAKRGLPALHRHAAKRTAPDDDVTPPGGSTLDQGSRLAMEARSPGTPLPTPTSETTARSAELSFSPAVQTTPGGAVATPRSRGGARLECTVRQLRLRNEEVEIRFQASEQRLMEFLELYNITQHQLRLENFTLKSQLAIARSAATSAANSAANSQIGTAGGASTVESKQREVSGVLNRAESQRVRVKDKLQEMQCQLLQSRSEVDALSALLADKEAEWEVLKHTLSRSEVDALSALLADKEAEWEVLKNTLEVDARRALLADKEAEWEVLKHTLQLSHSFSMQRAATVSFFLPARVAAFAQLVLIVLHGNGDAASPADLASKLARYQSYLAEAQSEMAHLQAELAEVKKDKTSPSPSNKRAREDEANTMTSTSPSNLGAREEEANAMVSDLKAAHMAECATLLNRLEYAQAKSEQRAPAPSEKEVEVLMEQNAFLGTQLSAMQQLVIRLQDQPPPPAAHTSYAHPASASKTVRAATVTTCSSSVVPTGPPNPLNQAPASAAAYQSQGVGSGGGYAPPPLPPLSIASAYAMASGPPNDISAGDKRYPTTSSVGHTATTSPAEPTATTTATTAGTAKDDTSATTTAPVWQPSPLFNATCRQPGAMTASLDDFLTETANSGSRCTAPDLTPNPLFSPDEGHYSQYSSTTDGRRRSKLMGTSPSMFASLAGTQGPARSNSGGARALQSELDAAAWEEASGRSAKSLRRSAEAAERSGQVAGRSQEASRRSTEAAGRSEEAPRWSAEAAGRSGEAPRGSAEAAGRSGEAAEGSVEAPRWSAEAAGRSGETPRWSAEAAGRSGEAASRPVGSSSRTGIGSGGGSRSNADRGMFASLAGTQGPAKPNSGGSSRSNADGSMFASLAGTQGPAKPNSEGGCRSNADRGMFASLAGTQGPAKTNPEGGSRSYADRGVREHRMMSEVSELAEYILPGTAVPAFGTAVPDFRTAAPTFGTPVPAAGSAVPDASAGAPEDDLTFHDPSKMSDEEVVAHSRVLTQRMLSEVSGLADYLNQLKGSAHDSGAAPLRQRTRMPSAHSPVLEGGPGLVAANDSGAAPPRQQTRMPSAHSPVPEDGPGLEQEQERAEQLQQVHQLSCALTMLQEQLSLTEAGHGAATIPTQTATQTANVANFIASPNTSQLPPRQSGHGVASLQTQTATQTAAQTANVANTSANPNTSHLPAHQSSHGAATLPTQTSYVANSKANSNSSTSPLSPQPVSTSNANTSTTTSSSNASYLPPHFVSSSSSTSTNTSHLHQPANTTTISLDTSTSHLPPQRGKVITSSLPTQLTRPLPSSRPPLPTTNVNSSRPPLPSIKPRGGYDSTQQKTQTDQGQSKTVHKVHGSSQQQAPEDPLVLPDQGQSRTFRGVYDSTQQEDQTDQGQSKTVHKVHGSSQQQAPEDPLVLPDQGQSRTFRGVYDSTQQEDQTDQGQSKTVHKVHGSSQQQAPEDPLALPDQGQSRTFNELDDSTQRQAQQTAASSAPSYGQPGSLPAWQDPRSRQQAQHTAAPSAPSNGQPGSLPAWQEPSSQQQALVDQSQARTFLEEHCAEIDYHSQHQPPPQHATMHHLQHQTSQLPPLPVIPEARYDRSEEQPRVFPGHGEARTFLEVHSADIELHSPRQPPPQHATMHHLQHQTSQPSPPGLPEARYDFHATSPQHATMHHLQHQTSQPYPPVLPEARYDIQATNAESVRVSLIRPPSFPRDRANPSTAPFPILPEEYEGAAPSASSTPLGAHHTGTAASTPSPYSASSWSSASGISTTAAGGGYAQDHPGRGATSPMPPYALHMSAAGPASTYTAAAGPAGTYTERSGFSCSSSPQPHGYVADRVAEHVAHSQPSFKFAAPSTSNSATTSATHRSTPPRPGGIYYTNPSVPAPGAHLPPHSSAPLGVPTTTPSYGQHEGMWGTAPLAPSYGQHEGTWDAAHLAPSYGQHDGAWNAAPMPAATASTTFNKLQFAPHP